MDFKNLKGHLTLISLVHILITSHLMKSRIVNENFLKSIASFLEATEPSMFSGADEFINALMAITENVSGNQKVLMNHTYSILKYVLPVLLDKLSSESKDVKFLGLKILTDVITQYIIDQDTDSSN